MEPKIHFRIDRNTLDQTLTADDLETIELAQEGEQVKSYRIKRMAARFMVDEEGKPLTYKQANAIMGQLTVKELGDALRQFAEVMMETAIPPQTGNS